MKRREFITQTAVITGILPEFVSAQSFQEETDKVTEYQYSVFTKAWKMPLPELSVMVKRFGFDGIELPVRPGFQVEPEKVQQDLPAAVKILADHDLKILSVAGSTDEAMIITCSELGIPMIRIMVEIPEKSSFHQAIDQSRDLFNRLYPLLEKHPIKIGIQNHCGRYLANAADLSRLLSDLDPKYFCAVWDPAHEAICGTEPELALDMINPFLAQLNLKNGIKMKKDESTSGVAEWKTFWTSAREGYAHWPRVVKEVKNRRWKGVVCLCAEYSEKEPTDQYVVDDFLFAKSLFNS